MFSAKHSQKLAQADRLKKARFSGNIELSYV